jgi:phenylalanyl-tRNA synthetase beta chain
MKFSLNWLKELVPFSWSTVELAERLTMAGIEVEGIEVQGQGLNNVVVAQILSSAQHPNADRLSVCEVDTGSGKKQIVCGAKNYKVGDKVPLALSGAKLPNGMEIKRSKLRGVESDGMMCSPKELGLEEDAQGLLILPPDFKLGVPITEALGLNDTILELEITPNRPDLLSHWGLARDIAALADLPAPNPTRLLSTDAEKALDGISGISTVPVRVENFTVCPRYTARIIRGVQVGPSPEWLRRRLASVGQRSISSIVDITNFILLELGQPLHAFDLHLLKGPEIIVRFARAGEKILRLDGETSELQAHMLVIADKDRPVAIAGVMGGQETGVSEKTTDILLESATFQASSIRKTSKQLGVSSDSSYRYERGVDPELAAWASKRATDLILSTCGGKVEGGLADVRSKSVSVPKITCRYPRVSKVLGVAIPPETTNSILKRLGCRLSQFQHQSTSQSLAVADEYQIESCEVEPPSYRPDLEREVDLIEEVSRVYGIDKIPGKVGQGSITTTEESLEYRLSDRIRAVAQAQGLSEASNYPIMASHLVTASCSTPISPSLVLANPISSEMDALRPSLFWGLLDSAARNITGGNGGAALFEIGRIFEVRENQVTERLVVGFIFAGQRTDGASWEKGVQGKAYDFYDIKGVVDEMLQNFGLQNVQRQDPDGAISFLTPGMAFNLIRGRDVLGYAGKVQDALVRSVKIPSEVFYAELDASAFMNSLTQITRYQPWPTYPAIRRDIALTLNTGIKHQQVEETLYKLGRKHAETKGILFEDVELFDVFKSDKLGADRKSLAYSMTYRSREKTLTDLEVNQIHDIMKQQLKNELSCELRE